jgi:uncharacterized caspase-like protein
MRLKTSICCLVAFLFTLNAITDAATLIVAEEVVYVRKGPGRTYEVLGSIQKNEQFEILDEKKGWYKISVEGTIGWVSGKAVKKFEKARGGAVLRTSVPRMLKLYDRTWAVVIGIDRYPNLGRRGQLDYAVSDARAVEKLLREELNFSQIKPLYNQDATKEDILKALNLYLADTGREDAVLVFFAGHGHTEQTPYGDVGYIVPHDGSFESREMYRNISMTELSEISKRIRAKHVFFVMDSCYSGQLLNRYRAGAMKPEKKIDYARLTSLTSQRVRQVLTAGGKGETVLDGGPFGHSVFTGRLIEAIQGKADTNEDGFITATELELYVGEKVFHDARIRGKQQNPQLGKLFAGEGKFVFRTKRANHKFALNQEEDIKVVNRARTRAEVPGVEKQQEPSQQRKEETRSSDNKKRKFETAKLPTEYKISEIAREGTFIAYANGIVKDGATGLEWFAGPDRDMTWNEAKSWVETLNIDTGGWRMPTIDELSNLYKAGSGNRNMTPLLKTTGWWVWSGDTRDDSSAWEFYFKMGHKSWSYRDLSFNLRGFAVRSRTDG